LDDLERQSDEVDVGFDVLDEWEERLVDELVAPPIVTRPATVRGTVVARTA